MIYAQHYGNEYNHIGGSETFFTRIVSKDNNLSRGYRRACFRRLSNVESTMSMDRNNDNDIL